MISAKVSQIIGKALRVENGIISAINWAQIRNIVIDQLAWEAVFGKKEDKVCCRWLIWELAQKKEIFPSSTHNLYLARGRGQAPNDFTVPAINIRGITYDVAQSIFKTAKKLKAGAVICEIARSEINYTRQKPGEWSSAVLAGAIKAGWQGPIFLQGDHFQIKSAADGKVKTSEIEALQKLIREAIVSGFYNIDIDASTLVDLQKKTEAKQQEMNIDFSARLIKFTRLIEPKNITVSLGGEIGHIGGKNSSVEEFIAYTEGLCRRLSTDIKGISKISIQTGTRHGGIILPNGQIAKVDVDFSVLSRISRICRDKYQISGPVQHGASTLPDQYFHRFPETGTVEIHLSTGFQNMIIDHPRFPQKFLKEIYSWLDKKYGNEKKEGETKKQFHYRLRKRAWGKFKKDFWRINQENKEEILIALEKRLAFFFEKLNVVNTTGLINRFTKTQENHRSLKNFLDR